MLEVFFQVTVTIFKYQVELFIPRDHLLQIHYIRMFQNLQQRYLPHGSRGYPLILMIQPDLLDSYNLVGLLIPGFIHDTICTLSNLIDTLELVIF